jgi:hypothetical protein
MADPKNFFISYNKADKNWVEWIAWQLEAEGYTITIQAWDFRPGGNFIQDMQTAATESERTIAVLSEDYLKSVFTQPEWHAAFAKDPTGERCLLLPVRVAPCDLKGLLPQIVYIDLVGLSSEAARAELLKGVKRDRAKPEAEPAFPGSPDRSAMADGTQPVDQATERLNKLRDAIKRSLAPSRCAMDALVTQFDAVPIPGDGGARAGKLAELLTDLDLARLVEVFNRAHVEIHAESDSSTRARAEEVLINVANLTIPIPADQARVASVQKHFADGQLALLALPVGTATVAEIIMAAADKRAVKYRSPASELESPWGLYAQPLPPEAGVSADAKIWIDTMRVHLANQFLSAQTRTAQQRNPEAMDKLINAELGYRLTAQNAPERYYFVCQPPSATDEASVWHETMQGLLAAYSKLTFVCLEQDNLDHLIAEANVSKAIRDILWRRANGSKRV